MFGRVGEKWGRYREEGSSFTGKGSRRVELPVVLLCWSFMIRLSVLILCEHAVCSVLTCVSKTFQTVCVKAASVMGFILMRDGVQPAKEDLVEMSGDSQSGNREQSQLLILHVSVNSSGDIDQAFCHQV